MDDLSEAQAQVKFKIVKAFTFTHDDHTKEHFVPGDYERPAAIANHWFVRAHTDNPPPVALAVGSPQATAAMRALVEKRRKLLQEAEEAFASAVEEGKQVFGYHEAIPAAQPIQQQASGAEPLVPAEGMEPSNAQADAEAQAAAEAQQAQVGEGEGTGEDADPSAEQGENGSGAIVARRKAPPAA